MYERYDVLFAVANALTDGIFHRSSTPRGELIRALQDIDETEQWVICDEADQLREHEVLYDLYEVDGPNLVVIGNSETDLFSGMDERLQSRLAVGRRIEFERYSAAELSAILRKRAEYALREPSVVSDRQLDWIAERVDGDARKAIRTLREVVSEASDHQRERSRFDIRMGDLEAGVRKAVRKIRSNDEWVPPELGFGQTGHRRENHRDAVSEGHVHFNSA